MNAPASPDQLLIERTIARAPTVDPLVTEQARMALDAKTKPRRSLGRLEDLACRVAEIRGTPSPGRLRPGVIVCVADHGVAAESVSAYPQEVTRQMLSVLASGRAAISVLAREAGAPVTVVDLGVREPFAAEAVLDRRVRAGTANMAVGPAMSRSEAERAVCVGIELSGELAAAGMEIVALGEMGIANTTAASAVTAALLRLEPELVCGTGTGVDEAGRERKVKTVWRALEANCVHARDPLGAIAGVGGLEIAALTGVVLGCAERRIPVVLDGFITGAAALAAVCLAARAKTVLIASHRSTEPGHAWVLRALDLEPLFELDLRLGEGTGAALALPLIASALAILGDMATFADAGVTDSGA